MYDIKLNTYKNNVKFTKFHFLNFVDVNFNDVKYMHISHVLYK